MRYKTADEYVAGQEGKYRPMLEELRAFIKKTIPEAEELINDQKIYYKHLHMLVGIGVKNGYCSFYTMDPGLVDMLTLGIKGYKLNGATIHLSIDKPLPFDLIKYILETRKRDNEKRHKAK